ncbi:hypothetical protein [Hydrogenimonas urashimensis]|uniref:hypothetical protein n=1 Tax=Hydrogenimonas urashimensis TaxID=2740515 RepID=UPI0019163997|nr:hypothetical protein [Hydrogenimonas urashimensis]
MSRAVAVLLFVSSLLLGAGANDPNEAWSHYDTFALKKDQVQHVRIDANEKSHRLAFRWTLYKNGGLVMHVDYDGHRFQPLLYTGYKRNAFRIDLFSRPNDATPMQLETPFALLIFTAFDPRKREAHIDMKIRSDEASEVFYVKGK